ncbi:putative pentatricopeptide [Medicago truncatula]|uniref:Putative pentatricopeptide n=2 Tax=Medicago truncatula TaxID=3880 RepID=A0A396HWJ7_MEDTR|nr:putative pentatricopeptide [Medicago truncatula]
MLATLANCFRYCFIRHVMLLCLICLSKFLLQILCLNMACHVIGIEVDIMSCYFLLKCLVDANRVGDDDDDDGVSVRCFFEDLRNFGPTPNIHTYTIMMNFYCRDVRCSADISPASEIFGNIYRSGETPNVVTYSTYIKGLCKAGSLRVVWKLICNMCRENQPINNHCFNAIMYGLCQRGELDEASQVLEEMKSIGILPDVYGYYVFVNAKDVGIEVDIMSCNFLLKCLVDANRVGDDDDDDDDDGVSVSVRCFFEDLRNFGPTPNIHAYTIMMNFYCRDVRCSADISPASEIFGNIYRSGETPNVVTYSTYIKGLCKAGSLRVVWKLICNMCREN